MLFFFNDTATTEIYTLSLHDALPISRRLRLRRRAASRGGWQLGGAALLLPRLRACRRAAAARRVARPSPLDRPGQDRKSTRLNSSHANISYAVFCLKKKKKYLVYLIL